MSFRDFSLHDVLILQENKFKQNGQNAVIKECVRRNKIKSSNIFEGIYRCFPLIMKNKYFYVKRTLIFYQ